MLKTYHIALACVILAVVVLLFGGESLSFEEWQEVCLNVKNHFLHNEELSSLSVIILEIRLPRVILALLVGASLSGSGVVMQTIFRNPLVDPFLLGISSGAMLGVAMAIAVVESNIAILAFFGANLQKLLLSSLLMGAFFLLLADVVAKTITPYDLPVGIATSVLGAPFFLWLLFRTRGV